MPYPEDFPIFGKSNKIPGKLSQVEGKCDYIPDRNSCNTHPKTIVSTMEILTQWSFVSAATSSRS